MPQGVSRICCVAQEFVNKGQVPIKISEMSLEQIRDSSYMRSVRGALADGRRIPACAHCWHQEDRSEASTRQLWNGRLVEAAARVRERIRQGLDVTEPLPVEYIQIGLGNKCNLACRMCNAGYSSRIAQDLVHSQWAPSAEIPGENAGAPVALRPNWDPAVPWFEQEEFLRGDLLESASSLKLLAVMGGEPLLSDAFARLLEEYVARGHAKNMGIRINSNLFHNEGRIRKVMDSLVRFWYGSVGASVDGYGAVYEYIRYPARWDIVSRNIRLVRSLTEQNPNLVLTMDTVVQPYNCLSLVDLLRFADDLDVECNPHVIEHPWFMAMQTVPRELRLVAAQRLRTYADTPGAPGPRAINRQHAARITRHFEMIEDDDQTPGARRHFVEFTRALDQSRQQDLRAAVPELADALLASPQPAPEPKRFLEPKGFLKSIHALRKFLTEVAR